MASRKRSAKEIIARLQMVETLTSEGLPIADAIRSAGISRWNMTAGGQNTTGWCARSARCCASTRGS